MNRVAFYILEGKEPKKVDPIEWATWFRTADRQIQFTTIDNPTVPCTVSTIFLGMSPCTYPRLFETTIMGGLWHAKSKLYHTYDDAIAGHQLIVDKLRKGEPIE